MSRILIVDDNETNIDVIKLRLESVWPDSDLLCAYNGQEAVEIAKKGNLDLILMDVMMPVMNGTDACREIKDFMGDSYLPIILITAKKTDLDSKIEGMDAGADEYVAKPIDFKELLAKVKAHLRVKELHDEVQRKNCEIREAHKKLKEMDLYKSSFIEKMSRDIEGPLKGIIEQLNLLSQHDFTPESKQVLEVAINNSSQLEILINQMFEVTRLEQRLIPSRPEKIDVMKIISEVSRYSYPLADQKQVSFYIEKNDPIFIYSDPKFLTRMLTNIAQAAIRFSVSDEDIIISCDQTGDSIKGSFQIANSDLSKLNLDDQFFDKFAQFELSEDLTAQFDLELPLARLLVEALKGSVWVLNDADAETITIGFVLPVGE